MSLCVYLKFSGAGHNDPYLFTYSSLVWFLWLLGGIRLQQHNDISDITLVFLLFSIGKQTIQLPLVRSDKSARE